MPSQADDVLHIAIVGGGATGVELAAELVEALASLVYYGIDELQPGRDVQITLIEGDDRILSALPEKQSIKAQKLLHERGITVKTSVRVADVRADYLTDAEGRPYPAEFCVWAAGIEAPEILSELGLRTNARHQIVVDAQLRSSDPHILAFGDCAEAPWHGENRPLPAKAQVASQQASSI
nr:FAD-dependent oxidoreductase [Paracandidimonas soli]